MTTHHNDKGEQATADIPSWAAVAFLVGAASALLGGYWDDAWHTVEGRDSALIAPHIAIYSGITLAGGSLAAWTLLVAMGSGARSVLRNGPLLTALLAVALTLASAPIDNAWHVAFGRDSVIWSPPHILGIVGTVGLAVAMLVALRASPAPWARHLLDPTGGLILAGAAFVVVEYDTDVPQFSYLWYLPALSLVAGFGLAVIRRLSQTQMAATRAALWHLGFVAVASAVLVARGYDAVRIPVLLLPAFALDVAVRRNLGAIASGGLVTAGIVVPSLVLIDTGTLAASELLLSVVLSFVAVLATSALVLGSTSQPFSRVAKAAAVVLALTTIGTGAVAPSAEAHDPGQGTSAGTVDLTVRAQGRTITLTAKQLPRTDAATRFRVVARRGGETLGAPLARRADGSLGGGVDVDADGRWFVYLEARDGDRQLESWLPLAVGDGTRAVHEARRFAYISDESSGTAAQVIVGGVLYAIVGAFLAALALLVRRAAPRPGGQRLVQA